jgi:hypothetical protein
MSKKEKLMKKKLTKKVLPPVIRRNNHSPHIEAHYCPTTEKWTLRTRFKDVLSPAYDPIRYIPNDARRIVTGVTNITFPNSDEALLHYTCTRGAGYFTVLYVPGQGFKGIIV